MFVTLLTTSSCTDQPTVSGQFEQKADPLSADTMAREMWEGLSPVSNHVRYWCSSEILLRTHENLEKLDLKTVAEFLATFSDSCRSNAEYSEWSNELLFEVLGRQPDRVIEILHKNSSLHRELIVEELSNPILDPDLDGLVLLVRGLDVKDSSEHYWQQRVVKALMEARSKG